MSTVDERVVAMKFDNAAFEQKIAATMASLDKLKASLDFANSKKGIADLSAAANGFNMGNMGSAIENVSAKFLAMSTIAITVLSNIVSRAFDAGLSLVKAFSLDPIIGGFREMETNMNSIQTILANTDSKGTTLDQVNSALEQLNTYSDQTIYNFAQMARNIGTFTAAGVDLDTSVNSIKGIANLAAISGSNAEQASTAMYQLSQALASGTVKLMDWNSVVNAGMGGEVFQKALFETGKSLGTIADTPIDTTFDEWKEAGNSFRGSLEEGWITAEVLTNTLQSFTGDLSAAQLTALGYTEAQAQEMLRLGALGKAAATEVKTLTQLLGTVKESVGSGWSKTFQIVIGDFEEAKQLFTGINDVIGGFVGRQADARNELLQAWKDMGGRQDIIDGVTNAFKALTTILVPIKEAFREFFPPMTAARLKVLTQNFELFTEKLILGQGWVNQIKRIFEGLFAALEIGWTVVKELGGFFKDLFDTFASGKSGDVVFFLVSVAQSIKDLNDKLVEGGGIAAFFDKLVEVIQNPMKFLDELKTKLQEFFKGVEFGSFDGLVEAFTRIKDAITEFIDSLNPNILDGIKEFFQNIFGDLFGSFDPQMTNSMDGGVERLGNRLTWLGTVLSKIWGVVKKAGEIFSWFWDKFISIKDFAVDAVRNIADALSNLGPTLLEAFKSDDFDKVIELLKIGIAGIFAGGFSNIAKNGLKVDFTGGALTGFSELLNSIKTTIVPGVTRSLNELTGTMQAMQTKLKAEALMKIAIAIGILTASVVVLSTVDAEALGKAMAALAIGFGQLIGAMALLNTITTGPKGAAQFGILAGGLILLAGAMLVLSLAVKIFSTMSWEELGKGLSAVTVLLLGLAAAMQLMPDSGAMIRAGVGVIAIAFAMNLLAAAMKIFATMSWEDIGKGLISVAGGLGLIVAAVNLMPKGMVAKGLGIVAIGIGLNLLAAAMKIFATMSWEEIGKGLLAVGGGLLLISAAMQLMPKHMLLNAAGILLVGIALNAIATSMKIFATMSWKEIGKGLAGIAASLLVLAGAAHIMSGTLLGAAAIAVMAFSLGILFQVLKEFSKMNLKELGKGLLGIAGVLLTLALTAGAISAFIGPLIALGVAMLALGAGFALFGFGATAVAKAFEIIAVAGREGVTTLMFFLDQLILRLPELIQALAEGIGQLVMTFLEMGPELITALGDILSSLLTEVIDAIPQFAEVFTTLVHSFLQVVRDVTPDFIATGFELLLNFLKGIRDNIGEITIVVAEIITNFLDALALKVPEIIDSVVNLLLAIIEGVVAKLVDLGDFLLPKGLELLGGLLDGVIEKSAEVLTWFTELPGNIWGWIGDVAETIKDKGVAILGGFFTGVLNKAIELTAWYKALPGNIVGWIGDVTERLLQKGKDILEGFWNGARAIYENLRDWVAGLPGRILDAVGDLKDLLVEAGKDVIRGLWNGILSMKDWIIGKLESIGGWITGPFEAILDLGSPSRLFHQYGVYIGEGLILGLDEMSVATRKASEELGNQVVAGFDPTANSITSILRELPAVLDGLDALTPTITPILDLTQVRSEASKLGGILGNGSTLTNVSSFGQAQLISAQSIIAQEDASASSDRTVETRDIKFEQNNYSPEALSVADIYRQTKNQIAMAKEELAVL